MLLSFFQFKTEICQIDWMLSDIFKNWNFPFELAVRNVCRKCNVLLYFNLWLSNMCCAIFMLWLRQCFISQYPFWWAFISGSYIVWHVLFFFFFFHKTPFEYSHPKFDSKMLKIGVNFSRGQTLFFLLLDLSNKILNNGHRQVVCLSPLPVWRKRTLENILNEDISGFKIVFYLTHRFKTKSKKNL